MGKLSVWRSEVEETSFPQLANDLQVDVVVIGGGITGITAAYLLAKAGKRVAVLESNRLGSSSTGFSTGNLYAPIGGDGLHTIADKFGGSKLREVVESRAFAMEFIEQVIQLHRLDCDFRRVPWSLFLVDGERKGFVQKEHDAAVEAGLPVTSGVSYPHAVKAGFTVPHQAQFNPLKYIVSLASQIPRENCSIFEHTRVTKVEEGDTCTVHTENGKVTASRVIMATHTPKGIYLVHTNLGPYREYAVAVTLKGEYPEPGIFWEVQETEHYSLRTYDSREGKLLMVLGQMHKVGQKEDNQECYAKLEAFLRTRFDVDRVVYQWSAQQYKSSDTLPYIGLSPGDSKTYIATGFAADGLTYGTLAALIISDAILGRENKWSNTYDASRLTPAASASKFIKENVNVAYELIKDWVSTDAKSFEEVGLNEGRILDLEGGKHAVHRDAQGNLHVCSAVCPHMGCIVHWNQAEESWDCPCHGSRFSRDGQVLEGPAINPLKKVDLR